MKLTTYQLGALRKADATLYAFVLPAAHGVGNDQVEIDLTKVDKLHCKLLENWAQENNIQTEPSQSQHGKYCGCEDCFNKHVASESAAQKEVEKQNAPGKARLLEYIKQGLLDDLFNRNVFMTFLDEKFSGIQVIRPDLVDAFVAAKKQELHWKVPEPAPSPEPVVRTLASGEPELPLDAGELMMHRASKAQLQDLSRRLGEGASHQKAAFAFQPMPPEITRKILVNCSREKLEQYRRIYGNSAIDARLQSQVM